MSWFPLITHEPRLRQEPLVCSSPHETWDLLGCCHGAFALTDKCLSTLRSAAGTCPVAPPNCRRAMQHDLPPPPATLGTRTHWPEGSREEDMWVPESPLHASSCCPLAASSPNSVLSSRLFSGAGGHMLAVGGRWSSFRGFYHSAKCHP